MPSQKSRRASRKRRNPGAAPRAVPSTRRDERAERRAQATPRAAPRPASAGPGGAAAREPVRRPADLRAGDPDRLHRAGVRFHPGRRTGADRGDRHLRARGARGDRARALLGLPLAHGAAGGDPRGGGSRPGSWPSSASPGSGCCCWPYGAGVRAPVLAAAPPVPGRAPGAGGAPPGALARYPIRVGATAVPAAPAGSAAPAGPGSASPARHDRQVQREDRAAVGRVGHGRRAAVLLGDLADDRQPEPAALSPAGVRAAEETVEHVGEVRLGRPRAVVADADSRRSSTVDARPSPPGGECRAALSSRLLIARSRRAGRRPGSPAPARW